jgi:hypothetical protein
MFFLHFTAVTYCFRDNLYAFALDLFTVKEKFKASILATENQLDKRLHTNSVE